MRDSNQNQVGPQVRPLLLEFAKTCTAPGRAAPQGDYEYDSEAQMVRWLGTKTRPFAIFQAGKSGPKTKKSDLEKGEDNKDRRMWS